MKKILVATFAMLAILTMTDAIGNEAKSPLDVVKARIDGMNQHNLAKFLGAHSKDVHIYSYPDMPIGAPGRTHLAKIFGPLFEEQSIHVEVHQQIQNGNFVISHETVVRQGKTTVYVYIYEVINGQIKSLRFMSEKAKKAT